MWRIFSCNIRDARAADGVNGWRQRRDVCSKIITALAADIICFQELRQNQRDDLSAALTDYASYGLPESADEPDAPNAIFWRNALFSCIDSGGYWLSELPQLPGSRSWGCEYIRLANYVLLQHRDGTRLRIVNTHLDDRSQFAREQQARLLAAHSTDSVDDELQILCGDMNCAANNPALNILTEAGWRDSYAAVHGGRDSGFTYHAFLGAAYDPNRHPREPRGRIDWILVRGAIAISAAEIIRDSIDGHFPSDHYFVGATLGLASV